VFLFLRLKRDFVSFKIRPKSTISGDFQRLNLTMWNILGSEFSSGIDFMRVTKSALHNYTVSQEIGGGGGPVGVRTWHFLVLSITVGIRPLFVIFSAKSLN
jgi:hypothetical protein